MRDSEIKIAVNHERRMSEIIHTEFFIFAKQLLLCKRQTARTWQ